MARARNIKPGFCRNEDLAECSAWARLCFALLPMLADREGRLEDRPRRIKGELFPFDSVEVEPLLIELDRHGMIARYVLNGLGLIQILGFRKHQNPHHREPPSTLPPHPSLRLDPDGKYIKPEALADSNHAKAEAFPRSHEVKALGKPEASPGLEPQESTLHGGQTLLIPDSGFLIPDSGEEIAIPGGIACRQAGDQPALALVETAKSKGPPDCPHVAMLALWAEVLPAMPQHDADQWKGARATHLRARWRETAATKGWQTVADGLTYFRKLFVYVGNSRFLTGRVQPRDPGKPPFVVTLAWLVKPENWAKTIEGTYHQDAA